MPVTQDAVGSYTSGIGPSPATVNVISVAVGASALLIDIVLMGQSGGTPVISSVVWDVGGSNQTMTLITSVVDSTLFANPVTIAKYGLTNPTPRANGGIQITYTGASPSNWVNALSYKGTKNTVATAFANASSVTGTSANSGFAVTSAVGDMVECLHIAKDAGFTNGFTSTNNTTVFIDNSQVTGSSGFCIAQNIANGAAGSVSMTAQMTLANNWRAQGVDIVAAPSNTLTATNLATAKPTFGQPAYGRVVRGTNLATATPTLGQPVFSQNISAVTLTANGITTGPAVVTASVLGQINALGANNLITAIPTFGGPGILLVVPIGAANLATAVPNFGQPIFGQSGVFAAVALATGAPSFSSAALVQTHVLGANALTTAVPIFGAPSMAPTSLLIANALATAVPTFGQPAFGQSSTLLALTSTIGAPAITAAILAQVHALTANALATQVPALGVPVLLQAYVLPAAQPLAVGVHSFGTPALGQVHKFTTALSVGSPSVGVSTLTIPIIVTFDNKLNYSGAEITDPTNTDPFQFAGVTVGPGPNPALLVGVIVESDAADYSNYLNVYWDSAGASPQLMTVIGVLLEPITNCNLILYGLLNPNPGSRFLQVQGSGGGVTYDVTAISFTNVRQASIATAFRHFTTASGSASTTPSVTVGSANGNMAVSFFFGQAISGVDANEWWWKFRIGGGSYSAGGPSKVLTAAGTGGNWAGVGVDVVLSVINVPLTAPNLTVGSSKSFGAPVMTLPTMVFASALATARPSFTAPAFTESNTFIASTLADPVPSIGAAVFSQAQVIGPVNAAVGPPSLASVGLFIARVFAPAPAFSTPVPTLGVPALGQLYALTGGLSVPAPSLGVGILRQTHVLPLPVNLVTAVPSIPAAPFGAGRFLGAIDLVVQPAASTAAVLNQQQVLPAATNLAVGTPALGAPVGSLIRALTPVSLVTARPTIPSVDVLRTNPLFASDLIIPSPSFVPPSGLGEILPPLAWFLARLTNWSNDPNDPFYDRDGSQNLRPVKQAIFTNYNDAIELSVSMQTLIGRTSPGWGLAEPIQVVDPLYLWDRKLFIDWSDVEQLRIDLTAEVVARGAAIDAETAARIAAITALTNAINANTAAITANANAIAANTAAIAATTNIQFTSDLDRLRQVGVAPNATWRNMIPHDIAVGSPAITKPALVAH